jgi:hypothetical protein
MLRIACLVFVFVGLVSGAAHAADVSLQAADWQPFAGTGTLANASDSLPGVGDATVLDVGTAQGTGFGFVQAGYASRSMTGRYVRATLKAAGAFILYVRVRGSDGADYYLSYASFGRPAVAGANHYLDYTLSADFPARYGAYQVYTLDVQGDLARLAPGVNASWIRWVAARGAMRLGRLEVLSSVEYLTSDDDGDLLSGAAEDALGTSPFLFDTDGDGAADGLEAANVCGAPLDPAVPASPDADPEGDGLTTRTELFLGSDCATKASGGLSASYGWEPFFPSGSLPAGAAVTAAADGSLVVTHVQPSAFGVGVVSPPLNGRLRLPAYLNVARNEIRFAAKSAEPFYVYVRVRGSNGQQYYVAYSSGGGAASYGGGYAVLPLGTLGYTFNAAGFTTVSRNLSADLSSLLPGVTVSRILWVAVRGRLSLRDVVFPGGDVAPFATLDAACLTGGATPQLDLTAPDLNWTWNDPHVLKVGDEYWMYASATDAFVFPVRTYRLTSADGISWVRNPATPVLDDAPPGAWDAGGIETPAVVYFQGKYHLFYTSYPFMVGDPRHSALDYRVGHAVSTDGVTFTRVGTAPTVVPSGDDADASNDWYMYLTGEPGPVVFNGELYLYFTTVGIDYGLWASLQVIGLVRSADGVTFSPPELALKPDNTLYPRSLDWVGYSTPGAVVAGGGVHLFVDVANQPGGGNWRQLRLHHASSPDGRGAWVQDAAPLRSAGDFSWAVDEIHSPAAYLAGTQLRLYFAGHELDGSAPDHFGIGMMTCELAAP